MGIQVARSIEKIKSDVIQNQVLKGGKISAGAVIKGDVKVVVRNIQGKNVRVVVQNAVVSGRVLFDGLVKELKDIAQENTAAAEGGLGIQITDVESDINSYVEQIQSTECGDINVEDVIEGNVDLTVENIGPEAKDVLVEIQSADAQQECLFNAVADSIQKVEQENEATAAGFLNNLFGSIGAIIGIVIAIAIGAFLYNKFKGEKGEGEGKGEEVGSEKEGGGLWLF